MANLCKENTLLSVDLKAKMHFSLPSKKRTSNNKNPFKGRRLQIPLGLYLWKLWLLSPQEHGVQPAVY